MLSFTYIQVNSLGEISLLSCFTVALLIPISRSISWVSIRVITLGFVRTNIYNPSLAWVSPSRCKSHKLFNEFVQNLKIRSTSN